MNDPNTMNPSEPHFPSDIDANADARDATHVPAGALPADAAPAASDPPHPRRVRSFVVRAGRLSSGQRRALDLLGPRYVLPFAPAALDWPATFGREGRRIVEIGFGMGGTTAEIAAARPDDNFVGIEVHEPGVGALLRLIDERGLNNIRIFQHDAVEVIEQMITANRIDGVHVYFPDPWHKARHHKRRLIQPGFVALLASRLRPGGYLHLATDWENYAEQMLEVLGSEASLVNTADGYAPRPDYRPVTKFENRGLKLGHGVWDLIFTKRPE
jgi:tRNA (guanine-N7-)-methyltransferase